MIGQIHQPLNQYLDREKRYNLCLRAVKVAVFELPPKGQN